MGTVPQESGVEVIGMPDDQKESLQPEVETVVRCGKTDPALRNGLSCVKPKGHSGNHEDSCGCWWRNYA
jgi:hypothetical protein